MGRRVFQVIIAAMGLATGLAYADTADPLEVKVDSAAYTVRYQYSNGWALAPKGTKLLVLKYTVRNTGSTAREYSREAVSIAVRRENGQRDIASMAPARLSNIPQIELGPGKSVSDTTWLEVSNETEQPLLTVRMEGREKPLVLNTKIGNQLGAFGKPGTLVATDEYEAQGKGEVNVGPWDFGIGKVLYMDRSPSYRIQAPDGWKYAVVEARFRNPLDSSQALSAYAMNWECVATDGTIAKWSRTMLDSAGERAEAELEGGKTFTGRLVFFIENGKRLESVRATDPSSGRSIIIRLK